VVGAEEEAPEAEGEDGDAGALPAVVVGGGDEAEAEVDGVACWSLLVGVVRWGCGAADSRGFLPVCMLTKLPQMKTLLLSRSPVMM